MDIVHLALKFRSFLQIFHFIPVHIFQKNIIDRCNRNQQQKNQGIQGEQYTAVGKKAQQILSKYESIKEFLKQTLQLEEQDACINACRMEHIITDTCHQKIEEYLKEQKHD